jgi:FkbM family methyltransferase
MIDVGANVGDSILAASAAESDAFLAFEPHPAFIRYLRANLRNLENVIFSDVACGADEGSVVLPQAARGTAGTVVAGNAAAAQVSLASLDASVPLLWKGLTPNFVKIDTDGFDIDVIEGGGVLLRDTRPWLLYEADPRLTATGIERHIDGLALLNDAGYRCAAAFTNLGHFSMRLATADAPSWRKLFETHSAKGPVHDHDVLLAPSEAELTHFLVQLGAKRWPGVEA